MPSQAPIGITQYPWPSPGAFGVRPAPEPAAGACTGDTWRWRFLNRLHAIFDKEPQARVVLSVESPWPFDWEIANEQITIGDATRGEVSVSLHGHTLGALARTINSLPDYSATLLETELESVSASVLLPSAGRQSYDPARLDGYTSILWSFADAVGKAFCRAGEDVGSAVDQVYFDRAQSAWLDAHASFYGIRREPGESDADYRLRTIVTVLTPKSNNRAIAQAAGAIFRVDSSAVIVSDVGMEAYQTVPPSGHTHHYAQFDIDFLRVPRVRVDYPTFNAFLDTQKAAGTRLRHLTTAAGFDRGVATPAVMGRPVGVRLTQAGTGELRYVESRPYAIAAAVGRPVGMVLSGATTFYREMMRRDSSMAAGMSRPVGLLMHTFSGQF